MALILRICPGCDIREYDNKEFLRRERFVEAVRSYDFGQSQDLFRVVGD
jgi:hypothetical protein